MVQALCEFKLETESRRRGWIGGGAVVRLGDGRRWHLPAITVKLLATMPELRGELRDALDLATLAGNGGGAADGLDDESERYDRLLAAVVVRLLGANYDLPAYTWKALLIFDDPLEMMTVVMSLSYALDTSREVWGPWLEVA